MNERIRSDRFLQEAQKSLPKPETKEQEEAVILEAAYQKALQTESDQIDMESFVELYGEQAVAADKDKVKELQQVFKERDVESSVEARKIGKILEMIVNEQIELNNWFGEGARTQQTTDYDDYLNGIDSVVEFERDDGNQFLGLAIDATFGGHVSFDKKFRKIRKQLVEGKMGTVKYFRTVDGEVEGKLNYVPRVVLSIDRKKVIEIAKLWVEGRQQDLAKHSVQVTLMQEVYLQLEAQKKFVEKLGQRQMTRTLEKQLRTIQQIIDQKKGEFSDETIQEGLRDTRYTLMQDATAYFFTPKNK